MGDSIWTRPLSEVFSLKKKSPVSEHATRSEIDQSMPQGSKLSNVQVSVDPWRVDPNTPLYRTDREYHNRTSYDISSARNADDLLELLSKIDPDVSAGIWNFLRLADSGMTFRVYDAKMAQSDKGQKVLEAMMARLAGLDNFQTWEIQRSVEMSAMQLIKYTLLRGGIAFETVLDGNKQFKRIEVVDPIRINFMHTDNGQYRPFQRNLQGMNVFLDIPTFYWNVLDPDAGSPYETPPFLPVIQTIIFNMSVMQDLQRVVKRTAFPRITIQILEETLRKFAPRNAQIDDKAMATWLTAQKQSIADELAKLRPEEAMVFFDAMKPEIMESKGNTTLDFRPLKEIIDQRIISGLKSLPTILGRQFGSSQTLSGVESLLYAKSIKSIHRVVEDGMSKALTLGLRLEGFRGYVKVMFNPVTLRPDHELESFRSLKQARTLELLSLGFLSDQEAAEQLTGSSTLPDTFPTDGLSGTMFYEKKVNANAQAIDSTRNPTAAEQAGGGRNRN